MWVSLCGDPEITGRVGCLWLPIVCVIITGVFAIGLLEAEPLAREDIILTAICFLITLIKDYGWAIDFGSTKRKATGL